MSRKKLLLIGSGGQPFRDYALKAISERVDVILVEGRDLSWQEPYVKGFHRIDAEDSERLLAVAREESPDGVLTYDEALVEPAARLARELGVPHTDPEAVRRCKDKGALRTCLTEAGLGPVRFAVAHDVETARRAAADIGYPVVLKPRALGGSIGVVRADTEADLLDAFGTADTARAGDGTVSRLDGVLVEEYLDGPEYSADCAVWQGTAVPLVVAEKEIGFAPYFEELGHVVPARPHPDLDAALELVAAAHKAAGLDNLVTHAEFRLTSRGPRIVEINVRLGGDLIPHLGALAHGVDLAGAAADIAVGREPDLSAPGDGTAAITMIYPPQAMRLGDVRLAEAPDAYPGLDRFVAFLPPGTEVRLPPEGFLSRMGFAVVSGTDRDECLRRRRAVEAGVVIEGEPLSAR
ncbi:MULTISPECIES: ATP-grasp domain-containing protein [unclassified Streptomyces]|uniref:ATP-grasp domain-containing protein n=1 Tax=unclassified Streptomyces TaxID=2593676 RepID=UPI0022B67612|nr:MULTISPECIES: ATP-grasp domain-containing protein [unclassified Streptomyces]MCZ7416447.1 ATP-grasp domain-containing protein [Streptomyces sp. WMMC897]MCZ7433742.1 ATP-grasp domain-containing protein [Streptomyces sp. WMMC1477]